MRSENGGAVSQLNSKTSLYRGFTILKLPRKNHIAASGIRLRMAAITSELILR